MSGRSTTPTGNRRRLAAGLRALVATGVVATAGLVLAPFNPLARVATAANLGTDNFNGTTGNSGPSAYAGWAETGDGSNSPANGNIRVNANALQFRDMGSGVAIQRNFPVTGSDTIATLTLDVTDADNDKTLDVYWGTNGTATTHAATIGAATSAGTVIRLGSVGTASTVSIRITRAQGSWGSNDTISIDNVAVDTAARANPDLPANCGIDVTVILDESGSMLSFKNDVVEATKGLVDAFVGTGSRMRLVEFGAAGRLVAIDHDGASGTPASTVFETVNATYKTGVESYLATGFAPTGGTNWEHAWRLADGNTGDATYDDAGPGDLVLFLTDGQPTYRIGGGNGQTVSDANIAAPIDEVSAVQASGAHVIGIGLGTAVTSASAFAVLTNLIEPYDAQTWDAATDPASALDVQTVDALKVGSSGALGTALRSVVTSLCQSSVSVTKVDGANDPIGNFAFTGSPAMSGGYQWVAPAGAAPGPVTVLTDADTDGAGPDTATGVATFQWQPNTPQASATFTFTETVPEGWSLAPDQQACTVTPATGTAFDVPLGVSGGPTGVVTFTLGTTANPYLLASNAFAACTVKNVQLPQLTLIKQVTNDHGGTATVGQFTLTATGPTPLSGVSGVSAAVSPGTYTLDESGPAGYTSNGYTCTGTGTQNGQTITLGYDQSAVCTIVNDDLPATLTLIKHVVNDHGGSATASDFTLTAQNVLHTLTGQGPQVTSPVAVGTYTLGESGPTGYSSNGWACSNSTGVVSQVTLAYGDSVVCEITNDDVPAQLTLVKLVTNDNGGTATPGQFTLSATGPTPISGPGGASGTVAAGTYTLAETNLPGYTEGAWSCTGSGATLTGDQLELALGAAATCTIVNDDQPAHLRLVKQVDNQWGGTAAPGDFTLTAAGPTGFAGQGSAEQDVNAGTYDLSEAGPAGYLGQGWTCTGTGTQTGDSIALAPGQSAECTVVNADQPAHLTLVKVVVNDDGGTAVPTDFQLSAAGPTPLQGMGGATAPVAAGTYTLDEMNLPGYTQGTWSCVGATFDAGARTVVLALDQSATCTIVNDDQPAHLTLVKVVDNANGGTATATAFTLTADGPGDADLSGAGGASATVPAGSYALSESGLPGYTNGTYTCAGGSYDATSQTVTLANGEAATCTVVNHDQAAQLTLVKQVVNTHGGTAVATDFTLTATGPAGFVLAGDGGASGPVPADTYTLDETTLPGYTNGGYSCDGGATIVTAITLTVGESATCMVVNRDQPAQLTLVKTVVNDDGGTATADQFTLTADGPGANDLSGPGPQIAAAVPAGTYQLNETNLPGYTASGFSCDGGATIVTAITLTVGESATCEIVNDDQPAQLTLVKTVVNDDGGTATADQFTLTADGPGDAGLSGPGGASGAVPAGTYQLSETNLPGYTASGYSCDGGATVVAAITLAVGESATCEIVNDDQPVIIVVTKTVRDGQPVLVGGNTYTVTYDVVVSNDGGRAGSYDLVDTPNFGTGTLITDVRVDGAPASPFVPSITLADNEPIAAGEQHTYEIEVTFSVAVTATAAERDCVGASTSNGQGTFNSVVVTPNTGPADEATACAPIPPARTTELTIDKTASAPRVAPGDTFEYSITVTNVSDDGAAFPVLLSDDIPADIRVDAIATSVSADPRWDGCAVTERAADGYGGVLRCELSGRLEPGDTAPLVLLDVTLHPASTATTVTNTAVVHWALADDPSATGEASDPATVDVVAQAGPVPTPSPSPSPSPNPSPTPSPTPTPGAGVPNPTPTPRPTPTSPPAPTPTPTQRPLPNTGSAIGAQALPLATGLVGLGLVTLLASRRRRPT